MKSGKLSPLLIVMMLLLAGTMAGMAWSVLTGSAAVANNTALWFAVGGIVMVAIIAITMIRDTRRQLAEQASQNERNQAAILQLLDEIADLAEGDLSIHASVTENFTGAIADSINFAIDQMRGPGVEHQPPVRCRWRRRPRKPRLPPATWPPPPRTRPRRSARPPTPSTRWPCPSTTCPPMRRSPPRWPSAPWRSPTRAPRWCRTPSTAWTPSAARSRKPPSASSGSANRARRSATSSRSSTTLPTRPTSCP